MKMNFIKIGSKFQDVQTHEILVVKSFETRMDAPFAKCNQFLNGKQIWDSHVDLRLLFNPKWYAPIA